MTLPLPYRIETDDQIQGNFDAIAIAWPMAAITMTPTLINGWAVQAGWGSRVTRTHDGLVIINGVYNSAAATAITAFVLPAGWRPTNLLGGPINYQNLGRIAGNVQVTAAGNVNLLGNGDVLVASSGFITSLTFSVNS